MDNLTAIRVFVQIVSLNSLSGAARKLALSNAAVSKHLQKLEEHLGARLLNRTTRSISLTEAGQVFYDRCERIIDDIEEAELEVTRLSATARGVLRINMPMAFGRLHIAPIMPEFLRAYPDLSLQITMTDSQVDIVESGVDVVVRIAELPDSSLIARKLAVNRRMLCAAPTYLEVNGIPRRLADLSTHNCLRYAYHSTPNEWRLSGPEGEQRVRVSGNLVVNNSEAHVPSLLGGVGIALLPAFIANPYLQRGELTAVLPEYEDKRNAIYAVHSYTRHTQPKVAAFVEFLVAHFATVPWDNDTHAASNIAR